MNHLISTMTNLNWLDFTTTSVSSFLLIFAAEIGDKSQLVCMTLAAKYRAWPVMLGSALAFLMLNTLAVVFGSTIANWLPTVYVSFSVTILFFVFGIYALCIEEDLNDEKPTIQTNRSIVAGTFLLITLAEFGDKTQLSVVALSSTNIPIAVWLGSTIALITTSALGIWAGRTLFQKMPIILLHRISGIIFVFLAMFAAYKTYLAF